MLNSKLRSAVLAALAVGYLSVHGAAVLAQDTSTQSQDTPAAANSKEIKAAKRLEAVTVTGSLIPQSEIETATPITTITAEDMKIRGFATVADALQQSSFATGGVQGAQFTGGFTPGAQTLSLFGLSPSYVKYLIDGRPMSDFPALYNGSDTFNSISGIPAELVERIDILPGGQSSLYGSDAIAGVINIVLKKKLDRPSIDVRYGFYQRGGGPSRRVTLADSFTIGRFNLLVGLQYEKQDAIWGFDRGITSHYYANGTSAPVAGRDVLVSSATGNGYQFFDPNNCANVSNLFGGSEAKQFRPGSGEYCGSFLSPGYRTLKNNSENAQAYAHGTFDINDHNQLYGDFLYNYDETRFATGSNYTFWSTGVSYGYIYDPRYDDYYTLQRAFAPEDIGQGGYKSIQNKQTTNAWRGTFGGKGSFGESNWDYDVAVTHTEQKLITRDWQRFTDPIEAYFASHVLGEQEGVTDDGYPIFEPNYAALYNPISPADFAAFSGYTTTHAKTWDNMLRGQVTDASLFTLPGGDAGIALVAEGGNQGWSYVPDARLLNGGVWGTTDVQGAGHRNRYAATTELRLPVFSMLTVDVSGRYDKYKVEEQSVDKATYNIGLEFRPFESLLLRGRYGTAFKAPTLSDEFQGASGYFSGVTDYYQCALRGFRGSNISDCPAPYNDHPVLGTQSGNTKLKPITAKVWNYGVVWSPWVRTSFSVDYYHYSIKNEVNTQSADLLSQNEARCRLGELDIGSPLCVEALSQITRDGQGFITDIYTPKVNVSNEIVNAITADAAYLQPLDAYGSLGFRLSYSDILTHKYRPFPGDEMIDLLRDPTQSIGDFKSKVNGSITWNSSSHRWGVTLYGTRYGSSPNYLASTYGFAEDGAGRLKPWILFNTSVQFNPTDDWALSLNVNNVANKMPPPDHSYPGTSGAPYNEFLYDPYGRAYYLEATYKF